MGSSAKGVGVLVVGGGMAGLVAASRALELGADVSLLDKGGPMGEGNTLMTTGAFMTAGVTPNSGADEIYSKVMAGGGAYPETARAYAENCQRSLQWLESVGIQVDRTGDGPPFLESSSSISAAPVWKVDVGPTIINKLRAFFSSHGGTSVSHTRVSKLLRKKDGVVGAEATDSGGRKLVFRASATVIATGGFQANAELLKRHVGRHAGDCKLIGSSGAMGDGLKMTVDAGAKAVNLRYFYGRMISLKALSDDRLWPYPTMSTLIEDGMVVNTSGKRFRDEAWGDVAIANALARGEIAARAFLIFDETAWERSKGDTESLVPANPWLLDKGGEIYKAENLGELAVKLGIDPKNMEVTLQDFNTAATKRRLGELAVPRINHPGPLKAPFYGVKLLPGIVSTMGGPLVNRRMSVLSRKGTPIHGLFAAGDVVGGLMGGPNGAYMGGLSQAAVTGLIAGESAQKVASLSD